MKNRTKKQSIAGLSALLTFGVFAVCILSVLLSGAGTYRRLSERNESSYGYRTCAQYIATKVRQTPAPQALSVEAFGGGDALVLSEDFDGYTYLTRIYCYDGWIYELFADAESEFLPADGQQIMPAQKLALSLEDGLLSVDIVSADGEAISLLLSIRGGEEGAS